MWVLFGGARHANASGVGLLFPRGRRGEDSAATRLGDAEAFSHQRSFWCWGGRGLPSRSIPQPHHSGPVPRSGTVPRSVTSSHGGTASHRGSVSRSDMVSLGMSSIVVATSEAEHRTSNEAARATDVAGSVPCEPTGLIFFVWPGAAMPVSSSPAGGFPTSQVGFYPVRVRCRLE